MEKPPAESETEKNPEIYDVIEEELLENSSNSEENDSEEDGLESSKDSGTSGDSEISDHLKDAETVSNENTDTPESEKIPDEQTDSMETVEKSVDVPKLDPPKDEEQKNIDEEITNDTKLEENQDDEDKKEQIEPSNGSNASSDDLNDFIDDSLADEMDMSDVSSSIAENESIDSKTPSPKKKPRKRQPPIMIGYRKRRKVHIKKTEDDDKSRLEENDTLENETSMEEKLDESAKMESSSSEENLSESSAISTRSARKFSGSFSEVTCTDKYCWICHKDGGNEVKCVACPRVYHIKCILQNGGSDPSEDPASFHCPECSAILKADNVNTRSPVLQTVNLDQLSLLLKHVINILKVQKDSHYFLGPVDTKEFPHYRDYIVYPMDLSMLEKNCKNKIYGCTEAFVADVKWILHNSIVFNSKTTKITNVAKNLIKICKREVAEIETCAECYYNLLVRKDTWFIEVCKRPHVLVWARLKGFPPWPAKALKAKNGMVDCRFFGAHDKAWVQLKHCFLYSKSPPQPLRVKRIAQFEEGIQECEKHIKKLKDKYGLFVYPPPRIPYDPNEEMKQLRLMLPNYSPKTNTTKYLIHPDRIKSNVKPKVLFTDEERKSDDEKSGKDESMDITTHEGIADDNEESTIPDVKTVETEPVVDGSVSPSEENTEEKEKSDVISECSSKEDESEKSSDKETENSESSEKVFDSANSEVESGQPEPPKEVKKKLVSVKKIETINASVESVSFERTFPPALVSLLNCNRGDSIVVTSPLRDEPDVTTLPSHDKLITKKEDKIKPKSVISVKNFAAIDKCDSLLRERSGLIEIKSNNSLLKKDPPKIVPHTNPPVDDFNLDKVKDEPVENEFEETQIINEIPIKPIAAKSLLNKTTDVGFKKRSLSEAGDVEAKKSKQDGNLRMVNITDAVTISLVDNKDNSNGLSKNKNVAVKPKPQKTISHSVSKPVPLDPSANHYGRVVKPVNVNIQTVSKIAPKFVGSRPVNGVAVNGTSPRPSFVMVQSRQPIRNNENHNSIGGILDECMNEFYSNFRKVFEDTLDKIAGKGDLRAKIILLQKEMENLKRNHELEINDIKRDYEIQIAESRAANIAQQKFDIASERLKFEQEKERAVKEAKSKQWCSNCQKSANYYCCWNTAYCDFECQKEHWNQHMHVCKNDVKKKTAECSENEPPRIMMQNDVSSNYNLLNGYDKPNTVYTFQHSTTAVQNRNNVNRIQVKNQNSTKTTPRPLLPRVTATVTCTPSSSSSTSLIGNHIATTIIDNSFIATPVRPKMVNSFSRQPQFHK